MSQQCDRDYALSRLVMKDLACLSVPSSSSSLNRRHSISVCSRKTSTDSSSSSSNHSSADQDVVMPSLLPENSLNVSQIHTTLQRELMDSNGGASLSSQLQTLDLRLDEVAHIRYGALELCSYSTTVQCKNAVL